MKERWAMFLGFLVLLTTARGIERGLETERRRTELGARRSALAALEVRQEHGPESAVPSVSTPVPPTELPPTLTSSISIPPIRSPRTPPRSRLQRAPAPGALEDPPQPAPAPPPRPPELVGVSVEPECRPVPRGIAVVGSARRALLSWPDREPGWLEEGGATRGWELVHVGEGEVVLHHHHPPTVLRAPVGP